MFVVSFAQDVEGWEDVSCGARGVFKKLISEGHGDRHPAEGDVCSCHLVGYYDDAEFENTRVGEGHPWEFHCGGIFLLLSFKIKQCNIQHEE